MKMGKIRVEPEWMYDNFHNVVYFEGGFFEESVLYDLEKGPKPSIIIPYRTYRELVAFVTKHEKGIIKTDREEDLKIIHKLLDLLEKR